MAKRDGGEATTGGTKSRCVFREALGLLEASRVFLSLSLITADVHSEGRECEMSQHFNCFRASAASETESRWKTRCYLYDGNVDSFVLGQFYVETHSCRAAVKQAEISG